jgi:aminopeptidase N
MDIYFQRHDGQAVTTDDFVKAMEDASQQDMGQFRLWYSQAGTPELVVNTEFDESKKELLLIIKQHTPDTPGQANKQALHIPFSIACLDDQGNDLAIQFTDEDRAAQPGTRTLALRKEEESFRIKIPGKLPVLSLLRNFSAPVRLSFERSVEELCFLLQHDNDPFNRWEAGQQLAMGQMQAIIAENTHKIPEQVFQAYAGVLSNKELDPALIAEIFTLPGESYLADNMEVVDIDGIHTARRQFIKELALKHEDQFRKIFEKRSSQPEYNFNAFDVARRRLRNLSLSYLMELPDAGYIDLCLEHFQQADNMTDSLSALIALSNRDCDQGKQALDDFYNKWSRDVLVVNKWLSVQAMSHLPGTLDRVRALTRHESFEIKNPNKVRALIGTFCSANQAQFHAANGQGYTFLTEYIIRIDALNPQIAARLLTPLTRWKRMDEGRQVLMQQALEKILAHTGLSRDVFEIASKALA